MTIVDNLSHTHWFPLGPAPISTPSVGLGVAAGRIEAAAADPTDPFVMYLAADNGGVWKTATWTNEPDGQPAWLALSDGERSLDFSGYHPLVVHPANHDLVLGAVSGLGAGVLKSTNGGLSWTLLGNDLFEGATLGSVAVHPAKTSILYVSVWEGGPGGGVYGSTDGGLNWKNTTAFHTGGASDVILAKWNPQILFAGLIESSSTAGVYRSSDGGDSWDIMGGSGLPSVLFVAGMIRLESASTPGTVYVSLYQNELDGSTTVGRFRTTDDGQSWAPLAPTPGDSELRSWHVVLAVDARDGDHVLVNDKYALYESTDGGHSWTAAESIGDDWVNVTFDADDNVVATADRNIYLYDRETKAWLVRVGNLAITEFYDITLDQQNPDLLYGISQDHFDAVKFDGYNPWSYMNGGGGEAGKVLVDPGNSDLLYVYNPLDPKNMVQRSTDGGQSWTAILGTDEFAGEDEQTLYDRSYSTQKSFVMDPNSPSRLLVGTKKILETTDAGSGTPTWKEFASGLSGSGDAQYITALAISSDGQAVYAATADGHVWLKRPNKFWEQRDQGLFGPDSGRIVDIRIDPADQLRAFAVNTGAGRVWYFSEQGGLLQWTNVSGDLPKALRVGSIFVDWQYSIPCLYVGTERGVYQSVDMGQHWNKFGLFLPSTVVADLQSIPALDVLAAGTFGRGVWEILVSPSRIKGWVFEDLDGNGIPGRDDRGISGVTVFLDVGENGRPGEFEYRTTTDEHGNYVFEKVPPGTYALRQIPPPGYVQSTRSVGRIAVAGSDLTVDFGNHPRRDRVGERKPYAYISDLNALPGRMAGEPVGDGDEI
jgi:photosystem II stability/assembly factor-like uncharacterized protein